MTWMGMEGATGVGRGVALLANRPPASTMGVVKLIKIALAVNRIDLEAVPNLEPVTTRA